MIENFVCFADSKDNQCMNVAEERYCGSRSLEMRREDSAKTYFYPESHCITKFGNDFTIAGDGNRRNFPIST